MDVQLNQSFQDTRKIAIQAAKAGNSLLARLHLAEATKLEPNDPACWLWLAWVAESPESAAMCLKQVLAQEPNHELALIGLKWVAGLAAFQLDDAPNGDKANQETTLDDSDRPSGSPRRERPNEHVLRDEPPPLSSPEETLLPAEKLVAETIDREAPGPERAVAGALPAAAENAVAASGELVSAEPKVEALALSPARRASLETELEQGVGTTEFDTRESCADEEETLQETSGPFPQDDVSLTVEATVHNSIAITEAALLAIDDVPFIDCQSAAVWSSDILLGDTEPPVADQLAATLEDEEQYERQTQPDNFAADDEVQDQLAAEKADEVESSASEATHSEPFEEIEPFEQLEQFRPETLDSPPADIAEIEEEVLEQVELAGELLGEVELAHEAPADDQPGAGDGGLGDGEFADGDSLNAELEEIELEEIELEEIELEEIELKEIELDDIQLDDIQLDDIQLDDIQLDEIELDDIQLEDAEPEHAEFEEPVGEAQTDDVSGRNASHGELDQRPLVLVVDDSPTVRKLVTMTLEEHGCQVVAATNGREAADLLGKTRPNLVLSDINMPEMDGYQLCKFVTKTEQTKHIPVILLSGKDGVFDRLRGKLVGSKDHIGKPFTPRDLIRKVWSYLPAKAST